MRIKMLQHRVGLNEVYAARAEYDLPDARALRWIESGFAVPVEPAEIKTILTADVVETATVDPVVETATKRRRKSRK